MAGYKWRAPRDLRAGVVMPPVLAKDGAVVHPLSLTDVREWKEYEILNVLANSAYNAEQHGSKRVHSRPIVAEMVRKRQAGRGRIQSSGP